MASPGNRFGFQSSREVICVNTSLARGHFLFSPNTSLSGSYLSIFQTQVFDAYALLDRGICYVPYHPSVDHQLVWLDVHVSFLGSKDHDVNIRNYVMLVSHNSAVRPNKSLKLTEPAVDDFAARQKTFLKEMTMSAARIVLHATGCIAAAA